MGGVMVGDPWLLTLAQGSDPERKIGTRLLRLQILTGNRTGHILDLSSEYVRRKIRQASRYGSMSGVMVRCIRCGWQAKLTDWDTAIQLAPAVKERLLLAAVGSKHPEDWAYMRDCPGEEYARDILEITSLPAERGE